MKRLGAIAMPLSLSIGPAFSQSTDKPRIQSEALQGIVITHGDARPSSTGSPRLFTGSVRIDPLFARSDPSHTSAAYVTFRPGARSAWHTHPLGQALIVTVGVGRVQRWGDSIAEIRPGDVVWI